MLAPDQHAYSSITWGIPSLGADWIDGVIADSADPTRARLVLQETVHRLPWGFAVQAQPRSPAIHSTTTDPPRRWPAEHAVVFACFNRPEKITPMRFGSWLEILRQVPDALLWIINDHPLVEERLRMRATAWAGAPAPVFTPKLESAASPRPAAWLIFCSTPALTARSHSGDGPSCRPAPAHLPRRQLCFAHGRQSLRCHGAQ